MAQTFGSWVHMDFKAGVGSYLIVVPACVARVVAREWSKEEVQQYIYQRAMFTAEFVEHYAHAIGSANFSFERFVREGILPPQYAASDDPQRLINMFIKPEAIEILVAGDPERNQSRAYMSNHHQGKPTSKRIVLTGNWAQRLPQMPA